MIALCTLLGLALGIVYLFNATPMYSSSSRLYVEQNGPKIINDGLSGQVQSQNYLNTQAELIKSSQILGPVADLPEVRAMKTFAGIDNPIGLIKMNLTAIVGMKDDLITLSYESPYPAEASDIVNHVVQAYRTYDASRKRSTAAEVLRILQKEQREREAELQQKVQALLQYKQDNPNLSYAGEKGNIIVEQLAKISDALTSAHLEALTDKGAYEAAKAMANDPTRMQQWIDLQPAENNPLWAEVQRLEIQLVTMRRISDPNTPTSRCCKPRSMS